MIFRVKTGNGCEIFRQVQTKIEAAEFLLYLKKNGVDCVEWNILDKEANPDVD